MAKKNKIPFSHKNGTTVNTNQSLSGENNILQLKSLIYNYYYNQFKNIVLSMFKYEGLPDTMNERYLEECLFEYGKACMIETDVRIDEYEFGKQYVNTMVNSENKWNIYKNPTVFRCYSIGEYINTSVKLGDIGYLRNNRTETPSIYIVDLFAHLVTECEISKQINLNTLKTPYVIRGNKDQKLSLINLFKKIQEGAFAIFGDKDFMSEKPIEVLDLKVQYFCDKIEENKQQYIDEFLTFFGINNNAVEKRERLLVDEVNANNEQLNYNVQSMLDGRREGLEMFNKRFGTNITVHLKNEYVNRDNEININPKDEEGEEE